MNKKSIKQVAIAILHDAAISLFGGTVFTVMLSIIIVLFAGIIKGFELYTILNVLRTALLIVGGVSLFILSGIMIGQKSNEKIRSSEKWKSLFHYLGPAPVLFFVSVSVLAIATVVDYIVWLS